MEKVLFKTNIEVPFDIKSFVAPATQDFENYLTKGVASEDRYFEDLRGFIKKQPDLMYALSILVSEGVNKNSDAFLREVLCKAYQTPRSKFVNYEHDTFGENPKGKNPHKYQIVGNIYDSQLASQVDSTKIPDSDIPSYSDGGNFFPQDSIWFGIPVDILVAWVLYKFEFPDLADEVISCTDDSPDKFGVSMEVLFSNYKFRIGGTFDSTETFDFDGNTTGGLEVKKGHPLADQLQKLWPNGGGRVWNGKPVIRILGGELFFSAMAITKNRGNERSYNYSIANDMTNVSELQEEKTDASALISAIANKSTFNFSECKIMENGKPDCACTAKSIANDMDGLISELSNLETTIAAIKKRKDVSPKSGEKKYGDVKFADPKNNKYPLDNEAHIRAAWNYFNMPRNKGKYSSEDQKLIRGRILAAWKKTIDKAGPPSAAKADDMMDMPEADCCPFCGWSDGSDTHVATHLGLIQNAIEKAKQTLAGMFEDNADGSLDLEGIVALLKDLNDATECSVPQG